MFLEILSQALGLSGMKGQLHSLLVSLFLTVNQLKACFYCLTLLGLHPSIQLLHIKYLKNLNVEQLRLIENNETH